MHWPTEKEQKDNVLHNTTQKTIGVAKRTPLKPGVTLCAPEWCAVPFFFYHFFFTDVVSFNGIL